MHGLRTTIYHVSDMAAAKAWYTLAFGKPPYFDEAYYVGFNIGGYELGLQPQVDSEAPKNTSVVAYWGVGPEVQEAYDRLLDLGARPLEPPTNVGGPLVVATVLDPWNNPIGLIYNPTFLAE